MNTPLDNMPSPPTPDQDPDKGSLMVGFLLGWAAVIFSGMVSGGFIFLISQAGSAYGSGLAPVITLAFFLPLLSLLCLIVWFVSRGKTRSMFGVLIAFGSQVALTVLLMAACFGFFAYSGGMH